MPSVTINEPEAAGQTPSQQAVAKAMKVHVVTDDLGRKITLRKPDVLKQFKLIEVIGPTAAANMTYVQMVLPLIYVVKIDDLDIEFPEFKSEVDVLITKLGDEGVEAVMLGVDKYFTRPNPEGDRDALKK